MGVHFLDAPVLSLAAVAHEGITYDRVEHDIDQCGGEQNAISPQEIEVEPGDRAADDSDDDQPNAETLGKVFANEQIGAGTDEATFDAVAFEGLLVDGDSAQAVRTFEFGRVGFEMGADPFVARRAGVGDVHGSGWWLVVVGNSRVATQRRENSPCVALQRGYRL